ncbi:MAG: HD domain-containing protein, partial [Bacillota bacterium]
NLTERFGTKDKISEGQILKMIDFVQGQLRQPWLQNIRLPLIGIGGTARNIAKMDQKRKNYPFSKVHNYRLGRLAAERLWEDLIRLSLMQRRKTAGLNSERADIIVAGVTIVHCLFAATRSEQLIISGCGLREGLFLTHYLDKIKEPQIIPDILMHSTHNMLKFYNGNVGHAYKVAELAGQMCDGWQELLAFDGRNRVLLRVAALLHDIGITVNYYDHARHSAYLVENARLFGLTHREQMLTAVIAGWHNGPVSKFFRRVYSQFLDEADWEIATKLALVLALAESLDSTEMGLIKRVEAGVYNGQARLRLVTDDAAPVERQAVDKRRKWFKKEFGMELIII